MPFVRFPLPEKNEGSRAPTGAGAEAPHPVARPRDRTDLRIAEDHRPVTQAGAPFGALLRLFSGSRATLSGALRAPISQLLAGGP